MHAHHPYFERAHSNHYAVRCVCTGYTDGLLDGEHRDRIVKTIDGGSTWTTETISASTLYAGSFVDSQAPRVAGAVSCLARPGRRGYLAVSAPPSR